MFRIRWQAWKALDAGRRLKILDEAAGALGAMEPSQTALFSLLGHKGDLMLVHFRSSFDELNQAELSLAQLQLSEFFEPTSSYLSVVEVGLYESTVRLIAALEEKGVAPGSPGWEEETEQALEQEEKAREPRFWPAIPPRADVC